MAKETLQPYGLPKDQGISPLALKTIGDMTPKQFKDIAKTFDNIEKTWASIEIKNMTPNQVEERANDFGYRYKKNVKYMGGMGRVYVERTYVVYRPTKSLLRPWQRIYEGHDTNHVEAYRNAMLKPLLEAGKQEAQSQLRPNSIYVQPDSFSPNLATFLLGKKYKVTALTTADERETVFIGRVRSRQSAREKAIRNIHRMNIKRQGQRA